MMQNPYEPTLNLPDSSPGIVASKVGVLHRLICWMVICIGFFLIACSVVFIAGNEWGWLQRKHPISVQALMLFVVTSIGAIPATVGFALQHYSRRYLRWRDK